MATPLSRDAIVAVTRDLIADEGLDAVSLRQVGARLEVTAPALYAHVADKGDLLRAVAEVEFARLIERFRAIHDADPVARTRAYCRAYVEHALEQPELFKTMFLFPPGIGLTGDPDLELPSATEAFALPAEAVAEAIERGRFRELDPLVASLVLWTGAHGLAEVLLMGFDLDGEFADELVETAVDTIIRGLGA